MPSGRGSIYELVADATCAQAGRHRSPSRWCDCGFYCLNTLDDARALALDPDYRYTVLLEVAASGRFMRYERGLRYARQRVTAVRTGRCGCGDPATMLIQTVYGTAGWRELRGVCTDCASGRPGISLSEFAGLLGGVRVEPDSAAQPPRLAHQPQPRAHLGAPPGPALDEVDRAALVPLLSAEVALLQARLDEVQRQLARLTSGE
jgi:hypothetical protein